MWFRWERYLGRWAPVVYHCEKPPVPKGEEERFTRTWDVPGEAIGEDGEPRFGALARLFPAPINEHKEAR